MKEAFREVMSQFYADGVPADAVARTGRFPVVRNNATIVKGMRRTGKTYFTYLRMRELLAAGVPLERIVHVNFDDDRLAGMTAADLHWLVDLHEEMFPEAADELCYYFLDELQDVPGWERFARRLVDSHRVQLCLTGSSSKMLSEDIATEMRGRSVAVELFPLSFAEFLTFNQVFAKPPALLDAPRTRGRLKKAFVDYLAVGGFPDVQGVDATTRIMMLQDYAAAVAYRDIIERHDVPSVQSLKYVSQYLLNNFGRKVSVRAIAGVLKQLSLPCDRESLCAYLGYYADAYFAYPVSLRTDSLAVRRTNPDKYYLVDTGMIGALKAKNDAEKGFLLENLAFLALRRGFNKIEYYNTAKGEEVDFFVTDKTTQATRLVQVSFAMANSSTREREFAALLDARRETGIEDCTIVTWDEESEMDGVRVAPAWKWCLEQETSQ
ncbi:MAG: ATP-binding protein [Planctomycetes bacterium]|nr:ATP-binding protein [Planctomycetota bacterium]